MAKKLINNTQELINRAQELRIETENKTMQDIAQELIDRLMCGYDEYYMYIDNYKQMKQAEQRNNEIEDEVASIKKLINTLPVQEETIMETTNNTATINPTETKEETIMKNNKLATATLNMNRLERLAYVNDALLVATKTSDELYIDKETLAQFLFDNDIISRVPSKSELKRTKREVFTEILFTAVKNLTQAGYDIKTEPVNNNDAKSKTDKLFALLKKRASDNEKNGYGYTISSWMLQAVILEAGTGLLKFKGHEITEEESKLTHDIYTWLKNKGFIKPVIYSVKEDENVRVYMPEYTGRTESTKTKLIPFAKSAGYTAKQCTSFLVTVGQQHAVPTQATMETTWNALCDSLKDAQGNYHCDTAPEETIKAMIEIAEWFVAQHEYTHLKAVTQMFPNHVSSNLFNK